MPNVEIVAVANRSLESSKRAAAELGIPRAYADWEQLLAAGGIDAVLIGTWPYMHREVTLAALDSGRHVLCQARMANDSASARHVRGVAAPLEPRLPARADSGTYGSTARFRACSRRIGDVLSVEVQMLQRISRASAARSIGATMQNSAASTC